MKKLLLSLILVSIVLVTFSSCASSKYGCPAQDQRVLNKAANRTFNK